LRIEGTFAVPGKEHLLRENHYRDER
jgi:hypothetical protein